MPRKVNAHLPCLLAVGVLLPLVTVPFFTWFWFYERAIAVAERTGEAHLERIAVDLSQGVRQIVMATDNVAYAQRMAINNFMPWFLEANATVPDKPHLWSQLNSLRTVVPPHVYAIVCGSAAGTFLSTFRRSSKEWGYSFAQSMGSPSATAVNFHVNIEGLDEDPHLSARFFTPNASFNSLRATGKLTVVEGPPPRDHRLRFWYQEAQQMHERGIMNGWSEAAPIIGGIYDQGLGTAAWFSLGEDSSEPFPGVCHSWLYLGDLHKVLAAPNIGRNGMLILMDADGHVIATSRSADASGGVGQPARYEHVCNITGFEVICHQLQQVQARNSSSDDKVDTFSSSWDGVTQADKRCHDSTVYTMFRITARAYRGYLVSVGRSSDFDGGVRQDRAVAVVVSAVVLVMAAVVVALAAVCFSRPLRSISGVLHELATVTEEHARKLDQDGIGAAVPEQQWKHIVQMVTSAAADSDLAKPGVGCWSRTFSACCARCSCNRLILNRLGGPEIKQLHASLVAMVLSLSQLAQKATEQEHMRRRFIRYIFHEVWLLVLPITYIMPYQLMDGVH